jgi:hypothetical protein
MAGKGSEADLGDIDALVGVWRMTASFPTEDGTPPRAETTFQWLDGRRFLVQRWRVDHPDVPNGIAIIGFDDEKMTYLQHYFDSRGVARVYEMSLTDGVWRLWRMAPGFSQRFTGTFNETADKISGRWEHSADGSTWEQDFDLTYTRDVR